MGLANRWKERINELPGHDIEAWRRHHLELRDGLAGFSDDVKRLMMKQLIQAAWQHYIDYDRDTVQFVWAPDKPTS